jgi:RNA polymerase sigma factor (TIGR02999 family)
MSDVTQILSEIEHGHPAVADQLLALVYTQLRGQAAQKLAHEKPGQTLQATGLVPEAYQRLFGGQGAQQHWDSRGHFFATAAEAMRRISIESARRKHRLKRGGDRQQVALLDEHLVVPDAHYELLALDEVLTSLASEDPAAVQLVQLRFFTGLSNFVHLQKKRAAICSSPSCAIST